MSKQIKSKEDLTGLQFGKLIVIKLNGRNNRNEFQWLCKCSCENQTEVNVTSYCLLSGNTTSCGCKKIEAIIKRNKENVRKFSDEEIKSILELYLEGKSIYYITKLLHISDYLVKNILIENCNLNHIKLYNHHTSIDYKYLTYSGSHIVYKIYKYLYSNATIFLDRKYEKFQLFLNYYNLKYKQKNNIGE